MPVRNPDTVQDELKCQYDICGSWREVRRVFHPKVPAGTLSTIAKHGDEKIPRKWLSYFGKTVYLPAPACSICGEVHVRKSCPSRQPSYKDLFSTPDNVLVWRLQNREVMTKGE